MVDLHVFDPGLARLFITLTLLHLGEDINLLVVSSFWRCCRGSKFFSLLFVSLIFVSSSSFSFFFLFFCTCMRVWTHTLSGRLSRKSSSFSENMADEDNQSIHNENNHVRTLKEYMNPTRTSARSCIIFLPDASHFNFKPDIIQLLPTFHGLELENPYLHLREFEEVCNNYNDLNCSINTIRLKLFPFSLKDKAKTWLQTIFKEVFPSHRTNSFKRQITTFP